MISICAGLILNLMLLSSKAHLTHAARLLLQILGHSNGEKAEAMLEASIQVWLFILEDGGGP